MTVSKLPTIEYRMLRHVDFHGADLHKIAKDVNDVFQDVYHWHTTGECPHKPSDLVVNARGDMAERAQGSYCRYCGNRLKIKRIEWELESPIPSAPRSA